MITRLRRDLPAYWRLALMWPQIAYAYRFNILFWVLTTVVKIYLLRAVWTAVYAGRGSVAGVELDALIAYLTLANLQLWITYPILAEMLQGRIREGGIAIDLARPVPLLGQLLAQQLGATAGLLPFLVLVLPLAYLSGNLAPPASPGTALLYLVSFGLAYLVMTMIGLIFGLLAFFVDDLISNFGNYPMRIFGGAAQAILTWGLPVAFVAYFPATVLLARTDELAVYPAVAYGAPVVGVLWFGAAYLFWRRELRQYKSAGH